MALDPSDNMLYAELFEDEDGEVERKARLSELPHLHRGLLVHMATSFQHLQNIPVHDMYPAINLLLSILQSGKAVTKNATGHRL